MVSIVTLTILGAALAIVAKAFSTYLAFRQRIEVAKRSGFPYVLSPIFGIGFRYIFFIEAILLPICSRLPVAKDWEWVHIIGQRESWSHRRTTHDRLGDTYMIVALNMLYLKTRNAELVTQLVTRKTDFRKPIEEYKIVDLFGRSMLTSEGQDWKEHKRVIAPSFSEKSNRFAFEESLRQAEGMMNLWRLEGVNEAGDISVENTAKHTATLSLNVICAAGFGVPQLWPHEDESMLSDMALPGFSSSKLTNGHVMMFRDSLDQMLRGLLNLVMFSPWMLKISPFKGQRKTYRAFHETRKYFNELLDIKKKQVFSGESDVKTMDLMGPMIKASDELPSDYNEKTSKAYEPILSRDEIISNSFILFFAGHETTANSLHFSMIYLAMSPPTQKHLQFDIENIVGNKPISEISYLDDMPRLYNSMVGAVLNEQLRLIPPVINIPKLVAGGDKKVTIDKKEYTVPDATFIHLNTVATARNPRYWPYAPSWISDAPHDLEDFVPERWLAGDDEDDGEEEPAEDTSTETSEKVSYESSKGGLYKPPKGAFLAFSEGLRACPGKRFAQVEITAVLTAIFQRYSVEFDVSDWASDEEVEMMDDKQKKRVYDKAIKRARQVLEDLEPVITLLMKRGDKVPVRFVEKGRERFAYLYDEE
ncbi:hypothetical protein BP5796_06322 [Coleophoma crateriformis]|uniref:Cytochrome P450 monooxygenase-like protein n=1 Tax=Coleophoma crateriformis TaxID=565419 RepID=A0A3D8RX07_9HELO|nr:hypothetical protein BP5796_06322 [Coleophoma crateriformis]